MNFTWTLLGKPNRTAAETDAMIHATHTARYHWGEAPGSAGDEGAMEQWLTKAREAGERIAEAEDRDLLFSDLATV